MIKHLIILSLTFLLISCGEEEEAAQPESKVATQPKAADQQPQQSSAEAPQAQSPAVVSQAQSSAEAPQAQSPTVVSQSESQEEVITEPPVETVVAANNEDIQEEPLEDYSDVIDIELPEEEELEEEPPRVQAQSPAVVPQPQSPAEEAPQPEITKVNEEGTFLVYNGSSKTAVLKTISGWFWSEHSEAIPPNECVRVPNRNINDVLISINKNIQSRATSFNLKRIICATSECLYCKNEPKCPQGDIIIADNASSDHGVIATALTEDVICNKVGWLP